MLKNNNNIVGNEKLSVDNKSETNSKNVTFTVGQDIKVVPTGIKEYGVFCDCGDGWSALVHISRITTKFVRNCNDYFTIGKPFIARIIEVHHEAKKLSLSTKEFNLEVKKPCDGDNDDQGGFKGLESNLDSWVKKDSNK